MTSLQRWRLTPRFHIATIRLGRGGEEGEGKQLSTPPINKYKGRGRQEGVTGGRKGGIPNGGCSVAGAKSR